MTEFWFIAVERFGPVDEERWHSYVNWAKLPQLREVVSLDALLCPTVINELIEEDWQHNIHEHFRTHFFRDLEYLVFRINNLKDATILAVVLEPQTDVKYALNDSRFAFHGYDLIEEGSGVSAINNCGGFENAFENKDVSEVGLIEDYELARNIQKRLLELYPEEIHADCDLWAIWRMEN